MSETFEQMRDRHGKELEQQVEINLNRLRAMADRHRREVMEATLRSQPAELVSEVCRMLRKPMQQIIDTEAPSSAEACDAQYIIRHINEIEKQLTE